MADDTLIRKPEDRPLTVKVHRGRLVIEIGISTLAFAAQNHPEYVWEDHQRLTVVDELEFAKDIQRALLGEARYEGPSRVEELFDAAVKHAVEDGACSVLIDGEPTDE